MEHEDQMADLESRLTQEFSIKISQYQEMIKQLKNENQLLYDEISAKQLQIDEQSSTIIKLKSFQNQYPITDRRMSTNTNKENLTNNLDMSDKLYGYWQKMKSKRNSRTRNSNNLH